MSVEDCILPRRSARIAALIHGESSNQAAMRSWSCNPADKDDEHENEDEGHLCWPQGGWPQLHLPAGPLGTSHEALSSHLL